MIPEKNIQYKGFNIEIYLDEDSENPLMFSDTGFELLVNNKYSRLGTIQEEPNNFVKKWTVYGYSHGGLSVSLTSFGDGFDSGVLGKIYQIDTDEYFGKEGAKKALNSVIETFNHWLYGEVYGYVIKFGGEEIDSCWGFYGDINDPISSAKEEIDSFREEYVFDLKHKRTINFLDSKTKEFSNAIDNGIFIKYGVANKIINVIETVKNELLTEKEIHDESIKFQKMKIKSLEIKKCPEWIAFNNKWEGKVPDKRTKEFKEFINDADIAQKAMDKIMKL